MKHLQPGIKRTSGMKHHGPGIPPPWCPLSCAQCFKFRISIHIYPLVNRIVSYLFSPNSTSKKSWGLSKVNQSTTESKWIKVHWAKGLPWSPYGAYLSSTSAHSVTQILHYTSLYYIIPIKTLKACRKLFIRLVSVDLPSSMTVAIAGHQSTSAGNLPGWSNPGCLVPASHP